MQKLLSIIIPTYNMENYLPRCLDSLIVNENMDALEVWIVNDGSKDKSSDIGHQYESKYPGVFNVIDKKNGNYGSCINAALPHCSGKYVKILDADDYFDTKNLSRFIEDLTSVDADLILTDYRQIGQHPILMPVNDIPSNCLLSLNDIKATYFFMHQTAYKTEILHRMNHHQTEGISYTDNEWVFYPLFHIKDLIYFNYEVYQYVLGRDGQTMDLNIRKRDTEHFYKIAMRMADYYANLDKSNLGKYLIDFVPYIMSGICRHIYIGYLMFNPITKESIQLLDKLDKKLSASQIELTVDDMYVSAFGVKANYYKLYRKHKIMTLRLVQKLCNLRSILNITH